MMGEIIKALIILPVVAVLDYKAVRYCTALQEADFLGKLDYFLMIPVVIFLSSIILLCFFTIIKNTSIN